MADRFNPTERIGVNKVESIFLGDFKWIPRTVLQSDVGIDMHVEIVTKNPVGKFISIQIKTGISYFTESTQDSIIYRGKTEHLNYWLNHEMPVIIVLHNPEDGTTIWEHVCEENIERTNSAWKIEIPKSKTLEAKFKEELQRLNNYPEHLQNLQRFEIDLPLINKLDSEAELILTIEQWVNKSDGRLKLKIYEVNNSDETLLSESNMVSFLNIKELHKLFPWSEFEVDEDHYEFYESQNLYSEYGIWDSEDKCYIGLREEHKDIIYEQIRPYDNLHGEVDLYRLRMKLSSLGKAYLQLRRFLDYGNQIRPLLK